MGLIWSPKFDPGAGTCLPMWTKTIWSYFGLTVTGPWRTVTDRDGPWRMLKTIHFFTTYRKITVTDRDGPWLTVTAQNCCYLWEGLEMGFDPSKMQEQNYNKEQNYVHISSLRVMLGQILVLRWSTQHLLHDRCVLGLMLWREVGATYRRARPHLSSNLAWLSWRATAGLGYNQYWVTHDVGSIFRSYMCTFTCWKTCCIQSKIADITIVFVMRTIWVLWNVWHVECTKDHFWNTGFSLGGSWDLKRGRKSEQKHGGHLAQSRFLGFLDVVL